MMEQPMVSGALPLLGEYIRSDTPERDAVIRQAHATNPWFIPEFSLLALDAIADEFLNETHFKKWISAYPERSQEAKHVAIIMAGNVPLVGFHDLLCVVASGHRAVIKLSDKDPWLLPFLTERWEHLDPIIATKISFTKRLEKFDAVIATGSNNSARYFEYYFKSIPHILRQNRNGVAILTGEESRENLSDLAKDIFMFFGLGCRNVSRIFVPEGYDFREWEQAIADWAYLGEHHKYRNNLDYNYTIYLINKIPHLHLGHLILKEDEAIPSRIGCVHYSYYRDQKTLEKIVEERKNEIQCVISNGKVGGWDHILFGQSQRPAISQYADGVDTMEFLTHL